MCVCGMEVYRFDTILSKIKFIDSKKCVYFNKIANRFPDLFLFFVKRNRCIFQLT
jgi:hypothetical protein